VWSFFSLSVSSMLVCCYVEMMSLFSSAASGNLHRITTDRTSK
jgi:NADH:ubiquinone oxidoreductase subunit B-like Fe-S oxidoreductase